MQTRAGPRAGNDAIDLGPLLTVNRVGHRASCVARRAGWGRCERPTPPNPMLLSGASGPQDRKYAVEHVAEPQLWSIEESSDCTQQVAQEISGTAASDDVEDDLLEVNLKPEQVQVQRSKDQIEDVAGSTSSPGRVGILHRDGDATVRGANDVSVRTLQLCVQYTSGKRFTVLHVEALWVERAADDAVAAELASDLTC